jgi:hypothetical protein
MKDIYSESCQNKESELNSLGGDPAARSRTATLLRLSPSH